MNSEIKLRNIPQRVYVMSKSDCSLSLAPFSPHCWRESLHLNYAAPHLTVISKAMNAVWPHVVMARCKSLTSL